jgi:single-strand DNA-binding protein
MRRLDMSDTYVTLHGWVGSDVTYRDPQGISVANFRVASTPRLKKEGKWVDGDTTWYSVTVWRHLAVNIRDSVRKGDAVVVHGRLRTDTWKREDGELNSTLQIEATLVGHDLTRGTSLFTRTPRPEQRSESEVDAEAEAIARSVPADLPGQVDSWGNALAPAEEDRRDVDAA